MSMAYPVCKTCGGTDTLATNSTARWHDSGGAGYFVITSDPHNEIDHCDTCGENPSVEWRDYPAKETNSG